MQVYLQHSSNLKYYDVCTNIKFFDRNMLPLIIFMFCRHIYTQKCACKRLYAAICHNRWIYPLRQWWRYKCVYTQLKRMRMCVCVCVYIKYTFAWFSSIFRHWNRQTWQWKWQMWQEYLPHGNAYMSHLCLLVYLADQPVSMSEATEL